MFNNEEKYNRLKNFAGGSQIDIYCGSEQIENWGFKRASTPCM
jgi:hypothetical protein